MNKFRLWCILYTSFGAFFYGYDSGLTTSIIGYPEFISYFGFNATSLGALGSVYYAGNFIGASINVWLPDKFGRLRGIQVASVVSLIGCAMQTGAQSLPVLLVGRAIGGVGCGIVSRTWWTGMILTMNRSGRCAQCSQVRCHHPTYVVVSEVFTRKVPPG